MRKPSGMPLDLERVERILSIMKTPKTEDAIVFFGDSQIQLFDLETHFASESALINSGVGGIDSASLSLILDETVLKHKPKQVFILVGTNDLGETLMNSPKEIAQNITDLVDKILESYPSCDVNVISILPCVEEEHGFMFTGRGLRSNETIRITNRHIEAMIQTKATVIDVFSSLMNESKIIESYFRDGLHLTQEGYLIIAQIIRPYIK